MKKTILAISYYKNPELVSNLESILPQVIALDLIDEVIVLNDSPEDDELDHRLLALAENFSVKYIKNPVNLGYTKSINQAYRLAKHLKCNLICINSDVIFDVRSLVEVIEVSGLNERIGFVFPRADSDPNFKISGFLLEDLTERARFLPRFAFTPTAVGYFLFVSFTVIDRFSGFDELFSPGYEEENDLVMRAGALGLQAALANHAAVFHKTSSSFSDGANSLKKKHYEILVRRHPYYEKLIQLYSQSASHRLSSRLMEVRNKNSITIDCLGFPPVMNGTTIYALGLLKGLDSVNSDKNRTINVLVQPEVEQLLKLRDLSNLNIITRIEDVRPSLMWIRIGQPFDAAVLNRALNFGICAVNIFFDTIAQDVCSLRSATTEFLWQRLTYAFNDIVFISAASQRAFTARYPTRLARLHTIRPSMAIADYSPEIPWTGATRPNLPQGWRRILVVGNHFPHKDVAYTIGLLAELAPIAKLEIHVLTSLTLDPNPLVKIYPSGALPQETITDLYANCDFVVYPSYYEGFGLPIMEALHFKKPVILRASSLIEELKDEIGKIAVNIHSYSDTEGLLRLVSNGVDWIDAPASPSAPNWKNVAEEIIQITEAGLANFSFNARCEAISSLEA